MNKVLKHYKLILSILILLSLASLSYFVFKTSFFRIIDSVKDLINSTIYYLSKVFNIKSDVNASVLDVPTYLSEVATDITIIPKTSNLFLIKLEMYFKSLLNLDSILYYLIDVVNTLGSWSRYLLLLIPLLFLLRLLFSFYFKPRSDDKIIESIELKIFKVFQNKLIKPVLKLISSVYSYYFKKKIFKVLTIILILYYFNIFTIILEFIAYYLYLIVSLDLLSISVQVYKLVLDLLPMILFVPIPIWLYLIIRVINIIRSKIGYRFLSYKEQHNRLILDKLGQVALIVGSMGKGKTTALTDMTLSTAAVFREKAYELILKNDVMFPNFPYLNLERDLKVVMSHHTVYNLATCKVWLSKRLSRCFNKRNNRIIKKKLFGYDYEQYGLICNNGLKPVHLFEMLESYVQLYFIYCIETSLIVSNYGIREDSVIDDIGNFPLWNVDFFTADPELIEAHSRHAHIMDFDMFRLGVKMIKNNEKRNAFEFGVVVLSEVGKERGNMIENRGYSREDEEPNPYNYRNHQKIYYTKFFNYHSRDTCDFRI